MYYKILNCKYKLEKIALYMKENLISLNAESQCTKAQ